MKTTLIFVRHGQSEGNKVNRFNGHINLKLTELGKKQAECTAEYLDRFQIDAIYSSDLSRAYETGLATANRRNMEITSSKELREIFGGDFEGKVFDTLEDLYPEEFHTWMTDMGNCRCPNGESIRELFDRVNKEVLRIANAHQGQTVLITTHATPIRAMSTLWMKKNITEIKSVDWVKNASVTVVDYSDVNEPKIILYDEHAHLEDLATGLPKDV